MSSHPPGFFLYYWIYPEFRELPSNMPRIDNDLKYFGKNEEGSYRWKRRRRVIKEMQKATELKEMLGESDNSTSASEENHIPFRQCTK